LGMKESSPIEFGALLSLSLCLHYERMNRSYSMTKIASQMMIPPSH
jgi:hypothetical protein